MAKKNLFVHNHTDQSKIYFNEHSDFAADNLFYIQSFGYEDCTKGYYLERGNYDSFLLLYTIEGCGVLKYDSKTYRLTPKTCFLIDCKKFQNYYNDSQTSNWKFYFVHFNGLTSPAICKKFLDINSPVFEGDESILSLIKKIWLISNKSNQFSEIYCSELISSLISAVFRCIISESKNKTTIVEKVISYIESNFDRDIGVDEIAKAFYVNPFYLQHLFKKTISYSIYEYILKLRLERSEHLLVMSDSPVSDIAEKSGFNSTNSFIRFFKNKTGMTPTSFRKVRGHKID